MNSARFVRARLRAHRCTGAQGMHVIYYRKNQCDQRSTGSYPEHDNQQMPDGFHMP